MGTNLNINQQDIQPVRGMLDLQTMEAGVVTMMVSPNQATALKAGDFVKFDTANTGPYPQVLKAGQNDVPNGVVLFNVKQATFNAGDKVEISFFGGNVIFLQATAVAIVPGTQVESDATGAFIQAYTSNKVRGWALDYIPASGVGRIIQAGILQSA